MTPKKDFNWDDIHDVPERRIRMLGVLVAMICLIAGAALIFQNPDLRDQLRSEAKSAEAVPIEEESFEAQTPAPLPTTAPELRSREEIRSQFSALLSQ